jgi:hypothetical protein
MCFVSTLKMCQLFKLTQSVSAVTGTESQTESVADSDTVSQKNRF